MRSAPITKQVLSTGSSSAPLTVTDDIAPRQTVVVYKQNADGSTTNTGQVVQLTQTQILQLLNLPNAELQRADQSTDEGEIVHEIDGTAEISDVSSSQLTAAASDQQILDQTTAADDVTEV